MRLVFPLIATAVLASVTAPPPVAEISNLTATAILGWYAWHTATRTLPRLVGDFRRELTAERAQHRSDRDAFLREMAEERTQRHADNFAVVQAIGDFSLVVRKLSESDLISRRTLP